MMMRVLLLLAACGLALSGYVSEIVHRPGHKVKNAFKLPLPHTYISKASLPDTWNWANVNNTNFLTKSLNQHIPQYCGSCWAHGALSAFADRIKIARGAQGADINLAVQYILNCGTEVAGSCNGGSTTGTYEFVSQTGFVPYDTCLVYEACSSDSKEGKCSSGNYECSAINTCRTCSTFSWNGGFCSGIDVFPNASIAEYGEISGEEKMMAEIYARGPISCTINAEPLLNYTGGIFTDKSAAKIANHIISVTGYGYDSASQTKYWIVRNSWGEYWGELGYVRVARGDDVLGLEDDCAWATPASWTEVNKACYEDGANCVKTAHYVDPAVSGLKW